MSGLHLGACWGDVSDLEPVEEQDESDLALMASLPLIENGLP